MQKKISTATIKRLPKYYRYLGDLLAKGTDRISSKRLSEIMGFTASKIRQDLNSFGCFGQQGYGYNVEYLMGEIGKLLGLQNGYNAIIIGLGNMGQALANYDTFEKSGFKITGLFDSNPDLIGKKLRGNEILNVVELADYVAKNKVDMAIISVPKSKAVAIADEVVSLGIKGIWNFAPVDLELDDTDVVVENVHLSESLMTLSYKITNRGEEA